MAPLSPSLLFALGVALDLIYDSLKGKLPEERGAGFWSEWVGWAILSVVCWTRSIIYRRTPTSSIDLRVEQLETSARPSQRSGDLYPALALSTCLMGIRLLWQSQPEKNNWILVGPHSRLDLEPSSSYVVTASRHYRDASHNCIQTTTASGTR
jgi:hypothetical protein